MHIVEIFTHVYCTAEGSCEQMEQSAKLNEHQTRYESCYLKHSHQSMARLDWEGPCKFLADRVPGKILGPQ